MQNDINTTSLLQNSIKTNNTFNKIPKKQGLYDPIFEHDACGIGFAVNINGEKSHDTISKALQILTNLSHRGGNGSEPNSGDGAGILVQLPHKFFKANVNLSIAFPAPGEYGVGMLFLPQDINSRKLSKSRIERIVNEEGQTVLGWRDVPIDAASLGQAAKLNMPFVCQLFVGKDTASANVLDNAAFERKLYIIRKRAEKITERLPENSKEYFYFSSLSSKTIVYKGMLCAEQVDLFYKDLTDPGFMSSLALVHSRYSTNTFPSWDRAHPYRYIIHNGEINTLRGNVNWMHARQSALKSENFGDDLKKLLPVINPNGSDSAMFDNCLEFLVLAGYSLPHAIMLLIPEPWSNHESMSDEKKAFYEYNSCIMEPWDGPAAMAFSDGSVVGAVLDRNGLRPSRYYVTKDGMVIAASEVGVLDIPPENILYKGRLQPGRMLLIDTEQGRIINDEELKLKISSEYPYRKWLDENLIRLQDLPEPENIPEVHQETVKLRQKLFGYTYEDIRIILLPMSRDGFEAVGSMGTDIPLAILSDKPQLLYNYFKQLFAQVTNPPIDAIREEIVTATFTILGIDGNILETSPANCRHLRLETPILTNSELAKIKNMKKEGYLSATLPIIYKVEEGGKGLETALEKLFSAADKAIAKGENFLILSDRDANKDFAPIPALLAVSGLHHHLIRMENRTQVTIILESAEPREVHHFALLLGYGASAINPYFAYEVIQDMINDSTLTEIDYPHAEKNYVKAVVKGVVKTISKMGISTMQSYQGSQIFEALGISQQVIDRYFTWTSSRIGGVDLEAIATEAYLRHDAAFNESYIATNGLDSGGVYQWRSNGEYHMFNPETIHKLQFAVRTGDYKLFKEYSSLLNNENQRLCTIRGLLEFNTTQQSVPIEEVESVENICRRFKTGAMSYGSISKEAHEAIAIAMNRIGGKSNTGEGGEDPERYKPMENGDSKCSAIKQVASGRFGVTSEYLVNAKEIQIKMAQGAKPGEGGQLPGSKVYPWIAKVRHSTPGVELISPPPHHDIYSIEDLAELIHDLKNANEQARISVKLVSEVGVGTIAAGVAKGRADVVLISGYDGGTGASSRTSIRHAGLPWELGLAETHQTLLLNNLRSRIVVETDGKLMTGRDVIIAALLGAEEFGFATTPLVALGCVMMRVCNLDTCPVGVATQNPELRKKFAGDPQYVVNFMHFIATEMREYMAMLGFRTVNEMIGRTEQLIPNKALKHWKLSNIDLSPILFSNKMAPEASRYSSIKQNHNLECSLDKKVLLELCSPALIDGQKVEATIPIKNTDRVTGTILGSELTRRYGSKGLPDDTISLHFTGSAGQSFGAFLPKGITLKLEGDSNDYIGKGLSGGKIVVFPPNEADFIPEENIIIGNVAFYGATSGETYIRGAAGERFCVRNSGVHAVVEAVGDHCCEYMTGGKVIVLGPTGRNFAAGMSGGIAYVLDTNKDFAKKCNKGMVSLENLTDKDEIDEVKAMIQQHVASTGSQYAQSILINWSVMVRRFVKVMPNDYKRMLGAICDAKESGLDGDAALLAAFESTTRHSENTNYYI